MASFIYNAFKTKQWNGNAVDLDSDTIKVMLCTSSYSPNQDSHDFKDDVTNEVSSSGYTAGGAALANKTVTQDDTNNLAKFDADDVTWSGVTFSARYAVLYKDTGVASTSPLIALIDFGSDQSPSSANFTIQWSANGIMRNKE